MSINSRDFVFINDGRGRLLCAQEPAKIAKGLLQSFSTRVETLKFHLWVNDFTPTSFCHHYSDRLEGFHNCLGSVPVYSVHGFPLICACTGVYIHLPPSPCCPGGWALQPRDAVFTVDRTKPWVRSTASMVMSQGRLASTKICKKHQVVHMAVPQLHYILKPGSHVLLVQATSSLVVEGRGSLRGRCRQYSSMPRETP